MVMSGFTKVKDCLSNPTSENDDEIPIERRHDNNHYLVVERFITGNQSDIEVSTPTPLAPPEPNVQLSPAELEDMTVESAEVGSEVSRLPPSDIPSSERELTGPISKTTEAKPAAGTKASSGKPTPFSLKIPQPAAVSASLGFEHSTQPPAPASGEA